MEIYKLEAKNIKKNLTRKCSLEKKNQKKSS